MESCWCLCYIWNVENLRFTVATGRDQSVGWNIKQLGFDTQWDQRFSSSPPSPDQLWFPPSLLISRQWRLFPRGYRNRYVGLHTPQHLVQRQIARSVHPLIHTSLCCGNELITINLLCYWSPEESVKINNKMQSCNRIYYSKIYWRLNMIRAAYRSLSGAPNHICNLWFIYTCGDRPLSRLDNGRSPRLRVAVMN